MSELDMIMAVKAGRIKGIWSDVDGVMTKQEGVTIYDVLEHESITRIPTFLRRNGTDSLMLLPCTAQGEPIGEITYFGGKTGEATMEGYTFKTQDGLLTERVIKRGVPVYFISGRNSPAVQRRAETLGARAFLGKKDKLSVIREQIDGTGCTLREIVFIGDGIQDVETHEAVREAGGITIAPRDASDEAKAVAEIITVANGGEGVIYEVLRSFMMARGMWPA